MVFPHFCNIAFRLVPLKNPKEEGPKEVWMAIGKPSRNANKTRRGEWILSGRRRYITNVC